MLSYAHGLFDSVRKSLSLFFKPFFPEQCEHVFLVGLNAGLVEGIDAQQV